MTDWVARVKDKLEAYRALRDEGDGAPAGTPIDPAALEAIERKWHLRLPIEYRDYILRIENGGLGPDYGIVPLTLDANGGMPAPPKPKAKTKGVVPDPKRPFVLDGRFNVLDPNGKRRPFPVPDGSSAYDGAVMLADHGCGYFTFLVVNGPKAGEIWCDYTAAMEDAFVGPLGVTFLPWFERWLDDGLRGAIGRHVSEALESGERVARHDLVEAHETLATVKDDPLTAIARIELDLYLGRRERAIALLDETERAHPGDPSLRQTRRIVFREEFAAAEGTDVGRFATISRHALGDVREAWAKNPLAAEPGLGLLTDDAVDGVRRAVAAHPSSSAATLERVFATSLRRFRDVPTSETFFLEIEAVLRNTNASLSCAQAILEQREDTASPLLPWLVRAATLHPKNDAATLARVASSRNVLARHAVAMHPAAPPELVATLARDPHQLVRLSVAARPLLDRALIDRLADDEDETVRSMVARHPATPPSVLARMTRDPSQNISYALATNERLTDDAKAVLELHPFYTPPARGIETPFGRWLRNGPTGPIRYLVLDGTSTDALEMNLFSHPACPLPLLAPFVEMQYGMGGYEMAHHPMLLGDVTLTERLATHPYAYTRKNIAERGDLPETIIRSLARDPQPMVRGGIASRAGLPPDIWSTLAGDEQKEVRAAAAMSPDALPDVLAILAKDSDDYVRRDVLRGPATPTELVDMLARDASADVRKWAALAPHLEPSTRKRLENDTDEAVRNWATWRRRADDLAFARTLS